MALFPVNSFPLESRLWAQTMNNEFLQAEKKQLVSPSTSEMLTDSNFCAPLGWQHKTEMYTTLTVTFLPHKLNAGLPHI